MSIAYEQNAAFHVCGSRRQRTHVDKSARLHRIPEILAEEGVTLRTVAFRMRLPLPQARQEAAPACDLKISDLYRWQSALRIPLVDLLEPPRENLSPAIDLRAKLLKAMRTVRSLQLAVDDAPAQTLLISLVEQLLAIMPELSSVSAWPAVGARRSLDEFGAITERTIPDEFFEPGVR